VKPRDVKLPDAGRKVLLGIRPEHLAPVQDLNADLKLAVAAVETLGADTLAHGRLASAEGTGGELVARLPGTSAVKPGDVLPLAVEPGMVHLFDRETGKRIEA
jgi:sn-glycerol 3-phosphate transport system ATP-binding protein